MDYLYSILCLFLVQAKATSASGTSSVAESAGTAGGAGAQQPPSFFDTMTYMLPMMLAMMLVYMLIIKPPAKGDSGDKLEFKKNDRVVTAGGIVGTVIKNDPDSDTTTLRVDESGNTKMQFLTSSIVKVLSDEKDKDKASSDKK